MSEPTRTLGAPGVSPSLEIDVDGIGWITFDDPERPLNILSDEVMHRLGEVLDEVRRRVEGGALRLLVIRSGKPDSFIAGADVDRIAALTERAEAEEKIRLGQRIFSGVATLPIPTVSAIHGVCLGGGLELALACRYRVASDSPKTRLGLPEVMLGILPAWGGTTRLPRWIGLRAALDLLLTGKQVDARKARRIGLVDRVLPAALFEEQTRLFVARAAAHEGARTRPPRSLFDRTLGETPLGRTFVLRTARKATLAKTGGHYPAPLRILDVLDQTLARPLEEGLDAEARAATELVVSEVSKSLIHIFRLREATRKGIGVTEPGVSPRPVDTLGVLGAGVMGGGIAQQAAHHGLRVHMKDIRHEAVASGLAHAKQLFDEAARRKQLTSREAAQRMERISGGVAYHGLSGAGVVVEAVVERMEVKRAVLRETETHVSPECILATNTSSLSVDEMAGALTRPERFCGMHFFNPVHRMPLVEVVRGARTSSETVATVYALAVAMGKTPIVTRDGPGFLVNRILGPYLNEAAHLLVDGASIQEIDGAAERFGMPMGPLRLVDEIGIDVSHHAGASLHHALGERLAPSRVLAELGRGARLGRKGGKGFYRYEGGKPVGADPTLYGEVGLADPGSAGPIDETVILDRLLLQMINEAARVLEEEIVTSAAEVDLGMVMGTGFPPFLGGLLRYADTRGVRAIVDRLQTLRGTSGERFIPAPLLLLLAKEDRGFYEAYPSPTGPSTPMTG